MDKLSKEHILMMIASAENEMGDVDSPSHQKWCEIYDVLIEVMTDKMSEDE